MICENNSKEGKVTKDKYLDNRGPQIIIPDEIKMSTANEMKFFLDKIRVWQYVFCTSKKCGDMGDLLSSFG